MKTSRVILMAFLLAVGLGTLAWAGGPNPDCPDADHDGICNGQDPDYVPGCYCNPVCPDGDCDGVCDNVDPDPGLYCNPDCPDADNDGICNGEDPDYVPTCAGIDCDRAHDRDRQRLQNPTRDRDRISRPLMSIAPYL